MYKPKIEPKKCSDVDVAFPTGVKAFLPPYSEVPDEFKNRSNKWARVVSKWFFSGLTAGTLKPKDGVNYDDAIRHLRVCMGSWEPKHEHKEAGVAYLMSMWFELDESKLK